MFATKHSPLANATKVILSSEKVSKHSMRSTKRYSSALIDVYSMRCTKIYSNAAIFVYSVRGTDVHSMRGTEASACNAVSTRSVVSARGAVFSVDLVTAPATTVE